MQPGPILESNGMRGIFQKNSKKGQKNVEKDKIEILGKNVLNFKIF